MGLFVWKTKDPGVVFVFAENHLRAEEHYRRLMNSDPETEPEVYFGDNIGFFLYGDIDEQTEPEKVYSDE